MGRPTGTAPEGGVLFSVETKIEIKIADSIPKEYRKIQIVLNKRDCKACRKFIITNLIIYHPSVMMKPNLSADLYPLA